MQVICTDGTVLQCARFEAIDSGVLLFEAEASEDDDEEGAEAEIADEASAFVPIHQLRFVLPDGFQPARPTGQPRAQQSTQPRTQAPPTGGAAPPQGQQFSMGGQSPQDAGQNQGMETRQGRR